MLFILHLTIRVSKIISCYDTRTNSTGKIVKHISPYTYAVMVVKKCSVIIMHCSDTSYHYIIMSYILPRDLNYFYTE